MSLPHIPVRILAHDPAEYAALADVLAAAGAGAVTGAVTLAGAGERPVAVILCPSGDPSGIDGFPAVVLGRRDGIPAEASVVPVPASLRDILDAVEILASATSGLSAPRAHGGWALDPGRLSLRTAAEKTISLTDTEARLLACLFDAEGRVVTREILLQRVWGYRPGLDTHTLETHIYRLRKKIEADPANPTVIVTDPDGYRFAAQE